MLYAEIVSGVVVNIVTWAEQDPPSIFGHQFIDVTGMQNIPLVGYAYNGSDFIAPEPQQEPIVNYGTIVSKLAFRRRMTQNERIALDNYESNQNLTAEHKAILKTFTTDFQLAMEIDLADPDLAQGLGFLELLGLLGEGRATEILTAPVERRELPVSEARF